MVFTSKKIGINSNKCVSISTYYGWRRLDLYMDISGFIFAFLVCLIGLFYHFPKNNFEYIMRGVEVGGILFAGTAIFIMLINIKQTNNISFFRNEKILFYLNNIFESIKQWSDEKNLSYESIEDNDKLSRLLWYQRNLSLPVIYIHLEVIDEYIDFKIRFQNRESIHSILSYLKQSMIKLGVDDRNLLPKKRLKVNEKNVVKVHQTILECILNPLYESRYFNHSKSVKKTLPIFIKS